MLCVCACVCVCHLKHTHTHTHTRIQMPDTHTHTHTHTYSGQFPVSGPTAAIAEIIDGQSGGAVARMGAEFETLVVTTSSCYCHTQECACRYRCVWICVYIQECACVHRCIYICMHPPTRTLTCVSLQFPAPATPRTAPVRSPHELLGCPAITVTKYSRKSNACSILPQSLLPQKRCSRRRTHSLRVGQKRAMAERVYREKNDVWGLCEKLECPLE